MKTQRCEVLSDVHKHFRDTAIREAKSAAIS